MYDRLSVEEGVSLPYFPESLDKTELSWQTKSFHRGLDKFKLTEDGRLLEENISHREKTPAEKQAEAEKWGFDSWNAYVSAYDEWRTADPDSVNEMVPAAVDGEVTHDDTENPPTFKPSKTVIDETWWADRNHHGSFEFHKVVKEEPVEYEKIVKSDEESVEIPKEYELDVFLSYEARFFKGELQNIVLVGRNDSREEIIEELKEYRNE